MKKIITGILTGIIMFLSLTVSAKTNISVKLNGKFVEFDTAPKIINDRTMVPMRAVFEKMGAEVVWDNPTVRVTYNEKSIELNIGESKAFIMQNGVVNEFTLDSPPVISENRTLVSLRFIAESLEMNVEWNEEERCVYISEKDKKENPIVNIEVENYGTIKLVLFPEFAPKTVKNFTTLAKNGFYDGLTYHRVINGFMIQGGDPLGTGMGGSADKIEGEFAANGFVQNVLSHTRGVISMARAADYNSASSQFFIVHRDSQFLDGQYAGFGIVTEGMDIVDAIAAVNTDTADKPIVPVVIKSITVEE